MPVVGYLSGAQRIAAGSKLVDAFRRGLGDTGYVEGHNVKIEYRYAEGQYDRLPVFAAELVARRVAVIAAMGPTQALAAKRATSTIPIVFYSSQDPVSAGLVSSLSRPGGNLTGVSVLTSHLIAKRIELLRELMPNAASVAILINPHSATSPIQIKEAEVAAGNAGLRLLVFNTASEKQFGDAFASMALQRIDALVVGVDPMLSSRAGQIVALAAQHRLPVVFQTQEFAEAGGLMSYGPSRIGAFRQVGSYAGRILAGSKPAEMPVQQPTKFDLVINLKTAKTLGVVIPDSILVRADEVIE